MELKREPIRRNPDIRLKSLPAKKKRYNGKKLAVLRELDRNNTAPSFSLLYCFCLSQLPDLPRVLHLFASGIASPFVASGNAFSASKFFFRLAEHHFAGFFLLFFFLSEFLGGCTILVKERMSRSNWRRKKKKKRTVAKLTRKDPKDPECQRQFYTERAPLISFFFPLFGGFVLSLTHPFGSV